MNEAVSPVEVNQGNVPATKGKVLYFEDDLEDFLARHDGPFGQCSK